MPDLAPSLLDTRDCPLLVLYLGLSGVVHPSASANKLLFDKNCWEAGHAEYEGVAQLERALAPWPSVRIVLTSTLAWSQGLPSVLERLGPKLAGRVIGSSFDDLTRRARLGRQGQPMSRTAYWSLSRAEVVRYHVEWMRPSAWVALDDDAGMWTAMERRNHCVFTDPCRGLLDPVALDRLATVLEGNFGISQVPSHV